MGELANGSDAPNSHECSGYRGDGFYRNSMFLPGEASWLLPMGSSSSKGKQSMSDETRGVG